MDHKIKSCLLSRLLQYLARGRTRLASVLVLALFSVGVAVPATTSQKTDPPAEIQLNKPIQKEIAGNEVHSYRVVLSAAQFASINVEQSPIDVSISVFDPQGKVITKIDLTSSGDTETLSLLSEMPTTYRVDIQAVEPNGPKGSYVVTMAELRASTARDKTLVAAERIFSEGMHLLSDQKEDSRRGAIEKYEQARALRQSINDQAGQAWALYMIAYTRVLLGEAQKAIEACELGLPLAQAAGERKTQAYLLDTIGSAHDALGDKKKSLEFYNQALTFRDEKDRLGRANTLNNFGIAYGWMGDWQKSFAHFGQVLAVLRELGNRKRESTLLNNLCVMHTNIGEYRKAVQLCLESLSIRREMKDDSGAATSLNNLGNSYSHLGQYQKALDSYLQSKELHKTLGERDGEAFALHNIGWVYGTLGEYEKSIDYYTQAVTTFRLKGDNYNLATALGNIGTNYANLKDYKKALEMHMQALPLTRATTNRSVEAIALSNIGSAHFNLGDKDKALDFYSQSLTLQRKLRNPRQLTATLKSIGELHLKSGDYQKALEYFNEGLTVSRTVGDQNGESGILAAFAKLERDRGNLMEARKQIEQAIAAVESLRINIKSAKLRASYLASVRGYFEFHIALLMALHKQRPQEGFDDAAFQISETSRARSLLELLSEARAEIRRGADSSLIEREQKLRSAIGDKAEQETRLLSGTYTNEQRAAAEKELADLTTEYEQLQAQIRTNSPRYAALTQPVPLDLKKIQSTLLDNDTLLLEYSLGEEKSFVWAVTPSSIISAELPKRSEIEGVARKLYEALIARNQIVTGETPAQRSNRLERADADYPEAATQLSRLILGPVAGELKGKRLLIVSEGMLQYVPFAALPLQTASDTAFKPLIFDHEIVTLPSASVLGLLREEATARPTPSKTVVVLADPVFSENDERIAARRRKTTNADKSSSLEDVQRSATESGLASLVRLRFSRVEAEEITKLAAEPMKLKAVDFAANRALATNEELGQYRIVHFATHGLVNNRYPELSGVVLSLVDAEGRTQNGFLRLYDIYNLKLNADLVVLSACQTALGKEIRGEGIVGLTRGFMYAGSSRVLASLWQTDDRATAVLMQRFYALMLKDQMRPAAALRAAQISMLGENRWQSPRYWAPFILQGEWK